MIKKLLYTSLLLFSGLKNCYGTHDIDDVYNFQAAVSTVGQEEKANRIDVLQTYIQRREIRSTFLILSDTWAIIQDSERYLICFLSEVKANACKAAAQAEIAILEGKGHNGTVWIKKFYQERDNALNKIND